MAAAHVAVEASGAVASTLSRGTGTDRAPAGSRRRDGRRAHGRSVVVLAAVSVVLAYALVVLGSTVRVTESGMGCPSWPLCYGHLGLVGNIHAWLEEFHRYMAALVTVAVLATTWAARRTPARRAAYVPALVTVGLVLFQAGLGALTVFAKNAPWTVAVHLVTGLVFLGATVVTLIAAAIGGDRFSVSAASAGRWAWVALGATLLILVTGSVVVDGGAAKVCPSWPLCTHPGPMHLVILQLAHRTMVGLASAAMVVFVVTSWHRTAGRTWWRRGAVALLVLLGVVASVGAGSALTRAQTAWQDLHLAFASLLWALLVTLVFALAASRLAGPAPDAEPAG